MFASDHIYILSVGAGKLVLAEFLAKPGQVPVLENYALGELGITPETETDATAYISAEFAQMSEALGMRSGATVWVALSGQVVFPRFVKLPPVTKDKLQSMIQYEAEQNVPFPISELVWDYSLIGSGESGEQYAMIVAAKNENVSVVTDCVTQAGFEPRVVDVAPMALYNCALWNYPEAEGCTLVVDIGARSTNLVYVERGRFFSRTVPIAGNAITQEIAKTFQMSFKDAETLKREVAFVALGGNYAPAEDEQTDRVSKIVRTVVTRLHAEINRSTNFYRSQQGGNAPARVLLTGGSSVVPYMDTFFREKLQVDVQYFNPFQRIEVGSKVDKQKLGTDAFVLTEVVGLAVRQTKACEIMINLIPQSILRRQTFQKKLPALAAAVVGIAVILGIWGFNARLNTEQYRKQGEEAKAKLNALNASKQELMRENKALDAMKETAQQYQNLIAQRTRWIRILANLQESLLPAADLKTPTGRSLRNSIWLTSFDPVVENGQVVKLQVSGRAWNDDMNFVQSYIEEHLGVKATAIENLVERVKTEPLFSGVEPIEQETTDSDNQLRLFRFTIALKP